MIDFLIATGKIAIYIFSGFFGYMTAFILLSLIQVIQYGSFNRFDCLSCNWMKGKKYFKPLTKEEQEWADFLSKTKESEYNKIQ